MRFIILLVFLLSFGYLSAQPSETSLDSLSHSKCENHWYPNKSFIINSNVELDTFLNHVAEQIKYSFTPVEKTDSWYDGLINKNVDFDKDILLIYVYTIGRGMIKPSYTDAIIKDSTITVSYYYEVPKGEHQMQMDHYVVTYIIPKEYGLKYDSPNIRGFQMDGRETILEEFVYLEIFKPE